ncbi:hypothetical protein CO057_01515 [Candidatus Uhrbacteria bacterium CG_4_9_14_0_2_um_filter_41_50]|uniref:Methyltransferase domain-containing protein n=1 Tax=Candidatus Uhrbacteria bacterium CG_4_9_14_0_2_um_filter_41_50 TaxID=1975031 RepID=A0A2M8EPQ9_9BACT|nr:MAG: hypothetical protein COZ45_00025 [Candidatus Uhrbacteria bacterium CG_4_10_14_3_um_filter_41_21]PIZ54831.1 MAG: hypothetical protein COY24_02355 [Candidatus Uhrbacteria bacterium CG_4_10_14_0_2_um_filter_41_21]PJB84321.1 MAG: hypothetical protein CO086_04105 [Candidatus Uhrbacteria bacterium CG_4_9_14_0_8_um_filter_41_16]PJC24667.1 MAG: hypothetical protein CO057_01515 [Candidatus Uhrbacteria bacterium CG_4_9_14_0_2_um_filter_41_50]PJE75056.1 MAG: hypothetical protein COV03_02040 [Candi
MSWANLIFFIVWVIVATAAWAGWSAAPWVPSRSKYRKLFLGKINIQPGQIIYDLGCGTGTVLFEIAKHEPNAKIIGYEISILPYLIAKIKAKSYKNVSVRYGNLFKQDLNDADVIFVFLLTKAYERLSKQFAGKIKDDCLVAFEAWPIPGNEPYQIIREEDILPIFVYKGSQFRK